MSRTKLIMLSLLAILALFTFVPMAFGQSPQALSASAQPVQATATAGRPRPISTGEIKVLSIKNASASNLSLVLRELFRKSRTVSVVPDTRTNSLVLSGTQRELDRIAALVDTLDSESTATTKKKPYRHETSVIVLKNRQAPAVGDVVSALYARRAATAPRTRGAADQGAVRIVIDEELNAIVAQGSPEAMKDIKLLVTQLDVAVK